MTRPPAQPRIHWATDLLLSLVVVLGLFVAVAAGAVACFVLTGLTHAWKASAVVVGAALLAALALTARGSRRLGYRITPWVAVATPFALALAALLTG
ncbi:hypothetical protein [Kitasatospora sp. NPDC059827]|uniref:hypothetical protein n=1 Tax=Kitasatospora sp. NPDC059827 TaxID=3346964 RepID=UPI003661CD22